MDFLGELLHWFVERRGWVAFGFAATIIAITLIAYFAFGVVWIWGIVVGTILAVAGLVTMK
jgi:hypothetical protein